MGWNMLCLRIDDGVGLVCWEMSEDRYKEGGIGVVGWSMGNVWCFWQIWYRVFGCRLL
jgi:hypothetical protein